MNNNANHVIHQINRVATPIKVDANGNRIEEPQVTQPVNTFENAKMSEVNTVKTQVKEHDSSFMIFIVVMLIILGAAISYITGVILPKSQEYKTGIYGYNDVDVTYDKVDNGFLIDPKTINNGSYITGPIKSAINANFSVEKNDKNEIFINNELITTNEILFPVFYFVGDTIIFGAKDVAPRTTRVFIVNKEGKLLYTYYSMGLEKGMVLGDSMSTFSYNQGIITLHFSRVSGSTLYSSLEYGSTETMDICTVDNSYKASADMELSHVGKEHFKEEITNIVSLGKYKTTYNLCR